MNEKILIAVLAYAMFLSIFSIVQIEKYNNLAENSVSYDDYLEAVSEERVIILNNTNIGRFNISFHPKCYDGTDRCIGWTSGNNDIQIVNNRSKTDIIETCNHEIMHNVLNLPNKTREEEIVEEIDDYLNFHECNELSNLI